MGITRVEKAIGNIEKEFKTIFNGEVLAREVLAEYLTKEIGQKVVAVDRRYEEGQLQEFEIEGTNVVLVIDRDRGWGTPRATWKLSYVDIDGVRVLLNYPTSESPIYTHQLERTKEKIDDILSAYAYIRITLLESIKNNYQYEEEDDEDGDVPIFFKDIIKEQWRPGIEVAVEFNEYYLNQRLVFRGPEEFEPYNNFIVTKFSQVSHKNKTIYITLMGYPVNADKYTTSCG